LICTGSALAFMVAGAFGCGDLAAPTGAALDGPAGPRLETYDPPAEVNVLQRRNPLDGYQVLSGVIGPAGGELKFADHKVGFKIKFWPGALAQPTQIWVVALPGPDVAYLFYPHGLVFQDSVEMQQDLFWTEAYRNPGLMQSMQGAYYPDWTYLNFNGTARIEETMPSAVDVNARKMKWSVQHFSGYLVTTGFRGGYISSSGNRVPIEPPPPGR
jgi:hypothetical protein